MNKNLKDEIRSLLVRYKNASLVANTYTIINGQPYFANEQEKKTYLYNKRELREVKLQLDTIVMVLSYYDEPDARLVTRKNYDVEYYAMLLDEEALSPYDSNKGSDYVDD